MELQFTPVPVKLDENCTVAIVAYTHDLMLGSKQGNLYFELNTMLRQRKPDEREVLVATWGGFMFYMMHGLAQLPDFKGVCWRGYNHGSRAAIIQEYQVGRPIQWGAFTSVTTSLDAAKSFAPQSRVVFKITVTVRTLRLEPLDRLDILRLGVAATAVSDRSVYDCVAGWQLSRAATSTRTRFFHKRERFFCRPPTGSW